MMHKYDSSVGLHARLSLWGKSRAQVRPWRMGMFSRGCKERPRGMRGYLMQCLAWAWRLLIVVEMALYHRCGKFIGTSKVYGIPNLVASKKSSSLTFLKGSSVCVWGEWNDNHEMGYHLLNPDSVLGTGLRALHGSSHLILTILWVKVLLSSVCRRGNSGLESLK